MLRALLIIFALAGGLSAQTTTINGNRTMTGAVTVGSLRGHTNTKAVNLIAPVVGDSGLVHLMFDQAVTITRVACSIKGATSVSINLDERAAATPDTAGTAVLTAVLVCDADQEVTTSFTNAGIAANVPMALTISAVSGAPDTLRVFIAYRVD